MLVQLWERLRGYNQWILTDAEIESSQMEDRISTYRGRTFHSYDSDDKVVWTDRQGNRQFGFLNVPDDSPLYQFVGGEKIAIRYNPDKPEEFYFPERLRADIRHKLLQIATIGLLIGVVSAAAFVFTRVFK